MNVGKRTILKRTAFHTGVILGITLVLLVLLELLLQFLFPEKAARKKAYSLAYEFNSDYLVSMKPNIKKSFPRSKENGGQLIEWQTNKDSFRGNALRENPGVRIIVYGDSNVQARFSRLENTYTQRLETYLREGGTKEIEVVNAGVIGFGPDQSLIRFTKEADIYKPSIVIFHMFTDNDFGDPIRNRLFELDAAGNLAATRYPKTVDKELGRRGVARFFSSLLLVRAAGKIAQKLRSKDKTADVTIRRYAALVEKEYAVYTQSKPRRFSHFADHYDLDVASAPDSDSAKAKVKLMSAVLREAKARAAAGGIELLVVIQPSVIDMTTNFVISYKHLERKYPGYKRTNLTDALERICVENDIHRVNLYDIFLRNTPEKLYFRNDNHWNDRGQDLAAKETASYITSRILSDKRP